MSGGCGVAPWSPPRSSSRDSTCRSRRRAARRRWWDAGRLPAAACPGRARDRVETAPPPPPLPWRPAGDCETGSRRSRRRHHHETSPGNGSRPSSDPWRTSRRWMCRQSHWPSYCPRGAESGERLPKRKRFGRKRGAKVARALRFRARAYARTPNAAADGASGGGRIGRRVDGGDDRGGRRARGGDRGPASSVMPPMATTGTWRRRAQHLAPAPPARPSGSGLQLAARAEHRAEADVVGAAGGGGARLGRVVRREADARSGRPAAARTRRASASGRSSWPRWTTSAPTASATSSAIVHAERNARRAAQRQQPRAAASRSARRRASLARSCRQHGPRRQQLARARRQSAAASAARSARHVEDGVVAAQRDARHRVHYSVLPWNATPCRRRSGCRPTSSPMGDQPRAIDELIARHRAAAIRRRCCSASPAAARPSRWPRSSSRCSARRW